MKDKFYFFMICLTISIIFFDCLLTLLGLSKGFSEGNPFMVFIFSLIGVVPTLIIVFFISIFLLYMLYYLRVKIDEESFTKLLYVGTIILISYRSYIIGMWVGALQYMV